MSSQRPASPTPPEPAPGAGDARPPKPPVPATPPPPPAPPAAPTPPAYHYRPELSDADLLAECEWSACRSSGPGGQHVNTTDSAVRLRHLPTGLVVLSRSARSQFRNRQICLERLREQLLARQHRPRPRRPTKPGKAARQRRLQDKTKRGETKRLRRPGQSDEG